MNEREIAKNIVDYWENHGRFKVAAGEDPTEPSEVKIARALLRVDKEYGCEVQDPYGTIWDYAAALKKGIEEALGMDGVPEQVKRRLRAALGS